MVSKSLQKISIAIATYNGAKYLPEQLDSLLAQSRLPDELIIVDDKSSDNTLNIIKDFQDRAPFKVIIEQNEKNLGYTQNFNKALEKTRGDLVFMCDQDDVWLPDKLATVEQYSIEHSNALVIMNDAVITDSNLIKSASTKLGQFESAGISVSNFVMGCCAMVRRDLLDVCLPIPNGFQGHDSWIVKMAEGVGSKHILPQPLQLYRRHNQNESHHVVNNIDKVSRLKVIWRDILNSLNITRKEKLSFQIFQNSLFSKGVHQAGFRADGSLRTQLVKFGNRLQQVQIDLIKRKTLCEKHRPLRLPGIINLWFKGGYSTSFGLKSAIQDFLFK